MRPQGFPRRLRLRQRREFLRVQRHGRKEHTRHFLVFVLRRRGETAAEPARIGITVTRKVAKAVGRNRIKRRVREAFRRERTRFPPGLDLVLVAKREAVAATYGDVATELHALATRLANL